MRPSFLKIAVMAAAITLLLLLTPAKGSAASGAAAAASGPASVFSEIFASEQAIYRKFDQMLFVANVIIVIYSVYRYGYNR